MALSEAIMKGQWPPQCLPPIMWSEEASSVSIERAAVCLGDNTALLAAGKTNTVSFLSESSFETAVAKTIHLI